MRLLKIFKETKCKTTKNIPNLYIIKHLLRVKYIVNNPFFSIFLTSMYAIVKKKIPYDN